MGVWIEIRETLNKKKVYVVTPCMGVWIEIKQVGRNVGDITKSLPVWECGLKSKLSLFNGLFSMSLPVWECGLKSDKSKRFLNSSAVTPCMGVWIEIELEAKLQLKESGSLPVWECGLKFAF